MPLPTGHEYEAAVISAILNDATQLQRVRPILEPVMFDSPYYRGLYETMLALDAQGWPSDDPLIVYKTFLERSPDPANALAVLDLDLPRVVATAEHAEFHARLLRQGYDHRQIILATQQIAALAETTPSGEMSSLLDEATHRLRALAEQQSVEGFVGVGPVLHAVFQTLEAAHERRDGVVGLSTGFPDVDRLLGGFHAGDLIVLAGRPSTGKTALSLDLARHVVNWLGRGVALFSLEMSRESLVQRLLAALARVDLHAMRTGRLSAQAWAPLAAATAQMSQWPLYLDETATLTIEQLSARARHLLAAAPLALVIVDYLQLMRTPDGPQNREQGIAAISRGLKGLAKDLQVPVLALSQLSRAVEHHQAGRPQLSDLRESGAIEQDADVVLLLYRPGQGQEASETRNAVELIVAKHRNGPTGVVRLAFAETSATFMSADRPEPGED